MRLRQIEVINAIMLTGSVSAAARLISVTQPAVSRTLQHAEIQLGFPLFQRTKNRLVPTDEALTLYPYIERVFTQLDEVRRLAVNLRSAKDAGKLRLLAVPALCYDILPRAIASFKERHSDISIHIEALHSHQIVSALLLKEADVGFVFGPLMHPSIVQKTLGETCMTCVAPKGMLLTKWVQRGWISLADLASVPVVSLDTRDPVGTMLSQACRDANVDLQSTLTVQTYHAALAMAHNRLAVALVDGCTARSAELARVDVLRLEPHISVPIIGLRQIGKPDSVTVRSVTEAVARVLADT